MDPTHLFNLSARVAVITGGAGLLGCRHAEAIAHANGVPILVDLPSADPIRTAASLSEKWQKSVVGYEMDVTDPAGIEQVKDCVLDQFKRIDILINNAAHNPAMTGGEPSSRLEDFPVATWDADLAVGLKGAFLCSKIFGTEMAARRGGVIVNIASDLSLISPDQRLYRQPDLADHEQPVKPVTYSVVKTGLIGLTRYLATYWASAGIRVNALSPGGVQTSQDPEFVARLANLIPMGRMAGVNEYQGALLFLCSDASSYMTGANLVVDGGRTCW